MKQSLNALFNPSGVAIVGASRKEESIGNGLVKNLLAGDYQGQIFPVNPKAEEIMGLRCYPTVQDINAKVDLVIIAIPRDGVIPVVKECAEKGVKAVVVISAGFKEVDEKGQELENKLATIARENDMALLGPNCLGVINTDEKSQLNGTFAGKAPGKGNISFISQSGAVGVYALEYADKHKINLAKFASLGNKAVSHENDILEAYLEDEQTKVILAYIEDFEDAQGFLNLAEKLRQKKKAKPLVVLKAGGSQSGQRAAASHTGALAEGDEVLDHLFKQYGIIRVKSLESLFYVAQIFSSQQVPKDGRLCIISNAGGPGVITADAAEKAGLKVPALSEELQEKLSGDLPETVSCINPVDLVGDATAERYEKAMKVLVDSDEIDILLFLCTPQVMTDMEEIAQTIGSYADHARDHGKMMVAVFADFDPVSKVDSILTEKGVPYYRFGNNAIDACAAAVDYYKFKSIAEEEAQINDIEKTNTEKLLKLAQKREKKFLTEPEAYQIFQDYGLDMASYQLVHSKEELKKAADELVYPMVLKVVSEQVVHKSDVGGVVNDIRNEEDLLKAFHKINDQVSKNCPEAKIDGSLLQEMVQEGMELIIGARFNEKYGHLIMFGLGGIFVEVLHDVTFHRAPLNRLGAMEMIEGMRSKQVLEGVRGMPALDKEGLADCLLRISQLVGDFPQIEEIDINPVFGLNNGAVIADARLIVRG
ncbi:MAG: acetate--CoA ligase family protein [Anditalea sp.]